MRHTQFIALGLVALGGCGLPQDRPYLIDDLSVVAVVSDPPAVYPSEAALLTAFIVNPDHPHAAVQTDWTTCTNRSTSENPRRCSSERTRLTADDPVGIAGGVLTSTAEHVVQAGDLAHVPLLLLQAGFWEHVRLRVASENQEVEAIKRMVVIAQDQAANTNPVLRGIEVRKDGELISPPYLVDAGESLTLTPTFDESRFDDYRVLTATGEWKHRQEEPVFTWHITGGTLDKWITEDGTFEVEWTLPDMDEIPTNQALCLTVLRDGRGGSAVWVSEVSLVD
ncbi:hypothetical protein ACFL6C_06240 [Myxococcota bacterium]